MSNIVNRTTLCALCAISVLAGTVFAAPAVPEYQKMIESYQHGDASQAYDIGQAYFHGILGAPQDYQKSVEWYNKAADRPYAMLRLGEAYQNGYGVAVNKASAMNWYRKAADAGLAEAQEALGDMYYNGEGAAPDFVSAEKWYRKAAGQGNEAEVCAKLGRLYLSTEGGIKENHAEALKWLLQADSLGDATADVDIATIYWIGKTGRKDLGKYAEWLTKGAVHGDTVAMRRLADAYMSGEGVKRNSAEAYKWLTVATAKTSDAASEKVMADLARSMSKGEIESAKKAAAVLISRLVTQEDRNAKTYLQTLKGN